MVIKFKQKFTSGKLDLIIQEYWQEVSALKKDELIVFDLTEITWIALEELNFLFGWIRHLFINKRKIFVKLPDLYSADLRKKRRLISLWNRWKIFSLVPFNEDKGRTDYDQYFNISQDISKTITKEVYEDREVQQFNDHNWHKIIPFQIIDASVTDDIKKLRSTLRTQLDGIFQVERQIEELLNKETCYSVFQNKTLSHIITTELYLNVIHHSFPKDYTADKECYLSIALSNGRNISKNFEYQKSQGIETTLERVTYSLQQQLLNNLKKERCQEEWDFYLDAQGQYRNESFIEFSFLDFGSGITSTLRDKFKEAVKEKSIQEKLFSFQQKMNIDTQILEYAFLLQSSRNEFKENIWIQNYIPRGLFFLVDILRRYNGLLIARSGQGKIVFDFKTYQINKPYEKEAYVKFSPDDSRLPKFQGSLFSIIIPAKKEILINAVQDKSKFKISKTTEVPYVYVDLNHVFQSILNQHRESLSVRDSYDYMFVSLNKVLEQQAQRRCILVIDFKHISHNVLDLKLYYFFCHHPLINENTNVIIINPPNPGLLRDIQSSLNSKEIHLLRPIPCVVSPKEIIWLGLKNISDEALLNQYWHYDTLSKPTYSGVDFENFKSKDFESLKGNIVQFDELGNMEFSIPDFNNFWHFLKNEMPRRELARLLNNPSEDILLGK